MMYNREAINKLSDELGLYQIYEVHGSGTQGDPITEGKVVKTLKCSEFDAWIISESINIERYGIITDRSSWETPMYRFRKISISS